jgi:hypothetical protein
MRIGSASHDVVRAVRVVAGLVEVAVESDLDLIDHAVRQDARHVGEELVAATLEVLDSRGVAADLCALQFVGILIGKGIPAHHQSRAR